MRLEIEALSVAYGPVVAVNGVALDVPKGSIVTVVGPNGAGKTSILNAVSGVTRATGRIRLGGRDISKLSPHARVAAGIVHVPEGRLVLAGMTVRENLELGGYRRPRAEVARTVQEMEERFPVLGERRNADAASLSGGEQQMLAIARGLVGKPAVLLLDEPSLGLAPKVVAEVFRIVRDLRAGGQTILLVEQNARKSLAVADYGYVLEAGRVVLEGSASALAEDARVQHAYLGGTV